MRNYFYDGAGHRKGYIEGGWCFDGQDNFVCGFDSYGRFYKASGLVICRLWPNGAMTKGEGQEVWAQVLADGTVVAAGQGQPRLVGRFEDGDVLRYRAQQAPQPPAQPQEEPKAQERPTPRPHALAGKLGGGAVVVLAVLLGLRLWLALASGQIGATSAQQAGSFLVGGLLGLSALLLAALRQEKLAPCFFIPLGTGVAGASLGAWLAFWLVGLPLGWFEALVLIPVMYGLLFAPLCLALALVRGVLQGLWQKIKQGSRALASHWAANCKIWLAKIIGKSL